MMAKFSRDKGLREERDIVRTHRDIGVDAERVPLSGATEFAKGDVIIHGLTFESKLRADGFKGLYKALGDNDGLIIRADRKERLYLLRETEWLKIVKHISRLPGRRGADSSPTVPAPDSDISLESAPVQANQITPT